MNNKTLGIILGILVLIFAISQFTGTNKSRSFDPNVLELDDSAVNNIEVSLPGENPSSLTKKGDEWYVSNGQEEYLADQTAVSSLLSEMKSVTAKKVVARSEEKAANFDTHEEGATSIILKAGNNTIADVNVGRFSFDQQSRQPISYIKKEGEEETYLVQSFMAMSAKKDFNSLRDKSFVSIDKDQIQSIQFTSPSMSHNVSLVNGDWVTSEGVSVDSTAMSAYLSGLSTILGSTFSMAPLNQPYDYMLSYTLTDGSQVGIDASEAGDDLFIVKSSSHTQNVFESNSNGIFKKTFGDLEEMLSAADDLL